MANLRMNDDLNIVAESPLVIEKLGDDLNIIQKLDDEPNDVGGMTSTELKETFDRSGNLIKAFINDKLIPAVLASDATEAARAAAETAREQAEAARKTAETAREQAETAREEHETVRVRQEQERMAAEQARDEAEKARVDSTTGIVAQATTQADAAKTAAQGAARDAEAAAQDARTAAAAAQGAAKDAGDAEASAGSAAKSEQAAQTASAASKSWAAGGTGTRPDEETNNAKYWAGVAEKAAGGGVTSFNGRAGVVTPQKGDYTAEMVGARPDTWTPGAADVDAVPTSEKGQPNGVATLDQAGKVPEAQLPERLSKQNLLSDETAAMYGLVWKEITVDLSSVGEGDTIVLPEGNLPVDFLVTKLDYESSLNGAGRVLLVRKGKLKSGRWNDTNINTYAESFVDTYLNGEYKQLFPEDVQSAMGMTAFYYTPGNGDTSIATLKRSIFLLSSNEFGLLKDSRVNEEGSQLPEAKKIPYLGTYAWTRSPDITGTQQVCLRRDTNNNTFYNANANAGTYQPAFTLPNTFKKTYYYRTGQVAEAPQSEPVPDDALKRAVHPTGTILWYAAKTPPSGYLICDGAAVSRLNYAALFAAIGTTFGAGDEATTFQLPDLRAAFIRGAGGKDGYSASFGSKQEATSLYNMRSNYALTISGEDKTTGGSTANSFSLATGTAAGKYYYFRPYNIALTPIIKY